MARRSNKPRSKAEGVQFDIVNGNFDDYYGYDIEKSLQAKLGSHDTSIAGKMSGIRVNNQMQSKDVNGVVDITLPVVDQSLSEESPNAVQNAAVAHEINSIKGNTIDSIRTDPVEATRHSSTSFSPTSKAPTSPLSASLQQVRLEP